MSLTRKYLAAMGIEADKIDEIISAHSETVEGLKAERDQYKKAAEELPSVKEKLEKALAENKENAPYKEKYEKEHQDFEAYKTEQTAKETKEKKTAAYKELLKEAGISEKHMNAVLKVTNLDDIELDDKGKIKDSDKAIESVKDEWSDFIVSTGSKGAETATPPAGEGNDPKGSSEARKIYDELQASHFGVPNSTNNGGKE